MAKGYVSTSDADGNPLTILYIHNRPAREDQFLAQLSVLSQFATAWNRGYPDVDGKAVFDDAQPCLYIVVTGNHHASSNTPNEAKHISVSVASQETWDEGFARSGFHVYSIENRPALGYRGWKKNGNRRDRFNNENIQADLAAALANDLTPYE